ncbi:hypothetical protein [Ancylomarina longa]|uniref:Uncharacterized protein n=1 Tax=Ancylomarina longa TaxID=2487017 RepID=A0A434AZT0_9BACT|nr:hypothetical protein [Ancylomarina longa]RUT80015.1 hypothetical protein DLK05_01275 [Ancylomarina longa]
MLTSVEQMKQLVTEAIDLGQNGKIRDSKIALRKIYQILKKDPFILWEDIMVSQLGKSIIMMIHWDLLEEEEENIGLALLSYLYISKGIKREENLNSEVDLCELFRLRKDRIILLKSCDDSFVDSLISFYFADKKATNLDTYNEQRKAVLSRLPYLQLSDIYLIEQDYPNLRNDEFLLELANYIESDHQDFSNENLKEAFLLHKVLYQQIYANLKDGKLIY